MQRRTKQRDAIWDAVQSATRPLGPEEIHQRAQQKVRGLGIATVYRTIKFLVDEGRLVPVSIPGQAPRYEQAGLSHHDHFYCRICDRVFELEGCALMRHPRVPKGFRVEDHEVTLYGHCAACRD